MSSASQKSLEEKTTSLKQLKVQAEKMLQELTKFQMDAERQKCLHVAEIEKAYNEAIEVITKWRAENLETIDRSHQVWLQPCAQATKALKDQMEEIESVIELSKDQLSGSKVLTVKDHSKLLSRIEDLSPSVEDCLRRHAGLSKKLRNELKSDVVTPKKLHVQQIQISTPKLLFTKLKGDCVDIRENANVLVSVADNGSIEFQGALTDGRIHTGKHYWELDVSFTVKTVPARSKLFYSAGVVQGDPSNWYVGDCSHSWGIHAEYSVNRYMFLLNDEQHETRSLPVYPECVTEKGTFQHGFYLNCEARTLTIIDCTYNRVLHTFKDLDFSGPLRPAVSVHEYDKIHVSVRLQQGNLSTLFKVLPNLLR